MTSGSPSRRRICGGRWRGYDWTVSSDISAVFRMKFYVFRKFYYLCTSIPAQSDIRRPGTYTGEMLEWLKRHAWKACIRQNRISGSNPDLSAPEKKSSRACSSCFFVSGAKPRRRRGGISERSDEIPERSVFIRKLDTKMMSGGHWLPGARATPARGIGKKLAQQG